MSRADRERLYHYAKGIGDADQGAEDDRRGLAKAYAEGQESTNRAEENVMCQSCKSVAALGFKCNAHRTESTSVRLIGEAIKAGHTLTGSVTEQALQAEALLGARPVVLS